MSCGVRFNQRERKENLSVSAGMERIAHMLRRKLHHIWEINLYVMQHMVFCSSCVNLTTA